ncbi:MAG TPA: CPBP family intramembrane glutamic endopeptidase [Chloroflexota bacterium]|nr:CPBP family intramembrane glutamic endopeptidase [Chloroflexota bacterium]
MRTAIVHQTLTEARRPGLDLRAHLTLAAGCLVAGVAPLAARSIADDVARIAYGLLVVAAFLAFTLFVRKISSLRQFWELSFAFFVFALVQVLNNSIPGYVGTAILHDPPSDGNPLASTVSGTVVIQLLETLIAIVPIVVLTLLSGRGLASVYACRGKVGKWLAFAIVFFVLFCVFTATVALRPDSPAQRLLPTRGAVTLDRFLALTPALLLVAFSNGFEEEFLFRGLFLQKYNAFFNARVSNVLQAAIFSFAHAGVTYTPSALFFMLVVVFPLGLLLGYLMRASDGVATPGIVHAALDIPIYLAFVSYVA